MMGDAMLRRGVRIVQNGRVWTRRRGMLTLALAVVACELAVAPGEAVTGAEWRRLAPAARSAYVAGIVDAWAGLVNVQESLGSKDVAITVFRDVVGCLRERLLSSEQVYALVERHVDANPGVAGKDMPDLVFAALADACKK